MPTKPGNGGYGQEAYDSNTGKYIAESGVSDSDFEQAILNMQIGSTPEEAQQLKELYESSDTETRKAIVEELQNLMKQANTSEQMEERFETIDRRTFMDWGSVCESSFSRDVLDGFYNGYRGAGYTAFEFNKALRMGLEKYYERNPGAKKGYDGYDLTEAGINERVQKLDTLTHGYQIPENVGAYRYLDDNYIVSQFEDYLDDIPIVPDDGYGYKTLDKSTVSVKTLVDKLQSAIGDAVPTDGGFTSVSLVENATHMGKHSGSLRKRIRIQYDIPKGNNMFISTYGTESEGILPRDVSYFIKDVKLGYNQNGEEEVRLYYGVRKSK